MSIGYPPFVILFMAGTLVFCAGLILRVSLYWKGQWDLSALVRGFFSTVFSKKIVKIIEVIVLDALLQRRLFSQDKLGWMMKVLIMIGYPGIILAGHLKVESMPQFDGFSHLTKFFYAPFCDFYTFRDFGAGPLSVSGILFAILFDLFGAMILSGELISIYRRFVAKAFPFKTSAGDLIAVNLLGGWFILRFFCEASGILAYSVPDSVARYWFVSFVLSKALAPLGVPSASLNLALWSFAGLFLASLVAFIPYNKKLWHIVTIPAVMFVNLMPGWAFKPGRRKDALPFSLRELLSLDSCVKCGRCVEVCPVYAQTQRLESTMGGFFSNLKSYMRKAHGLPEWVIGKPPELPGECSEASYFCTLCGRCGIACPSFIDTRGLRIASRGFVVDRGKQPQTVNRLAETLNQVHNIVGEPAEDRPLWVGALPEVPENLFEKEKARVVYFVGCVGSYFPMTKRIPQSFVQILQKAGTDFTILGKEEWCCGLPLIAAGMKKEADALIRHNLERVKARGAESVVCSCPSCYHTLKEEWGSELSIYHSTQFIKKLIDERKIRFKESPSRVTYHDPCDLGRASGVYEPPREILMALPGVELVEMENNREHCRCCGGGGDIEMVDPNLSQSMAQAKIEEIRSTGADIAVTACQQCVRTILSAARRKKIPLAVMDITEFVFKRMDG
jgi:heterodisulfide reductase subunit D